MPQLRIGADGNIMIDEESMMMEETHDASMDTAELVFENSAHTTSSSFSHRHYKAARWKKDESSLFFKALGQVGTDFTMMTLILPSRSRKELKNKFKREEKNNPHLVTQALKNQLSLHR